VKAFLAVIGIALLFLVAIGEYVAEFLVLIVDIRDDLKNRTDRGMLKKASSKHVI
jgi:hypothetical protein